MLRKMNKINDRFEALKNSFINVLIKSNSIALIMFVSIPHIIFVSTSFRNVQSRWRFEEIDEFDFTIRDVVEFIDRIRNIALLRDQRLVVTNLVTLLIEQIKMWYNYELNNFFKMIMQQRFIDQWINAFVARFTFNKSETPQTLEKQRYIKQDAANKRNSVDYLH
jgi:uncharacterized membrane protein